jgi:hypothetical protein
MFMALLVAAVAGMALRLQLAGDPAADPVFAVATAALALALLATTTLLVREVAGSSRRLVVHRDPRGPMTARDRPGNL